VARGAVEAGGHQLGQGDGASLSEEESLRITGGGEEPSEILLFDLA
jgi:redox-sensitive bicupin YhaK (pirin superfamily)